MFIDTHAHINYENKYGDIEKLLAEISDEKIEKIINVGWDLPSSVFAMQQAKIYPSVFFAAGFHPSNLTDYRKEALPAIADLLHEPKAVAVGEIGLDYHYTPFDEKAQQNAFCEQLELASSQKLPVIIHSRDAAADTLRILKDNQNKLQYSGVLHCFSGSPEMAKEYLKLGLYISFAGPVTFKNARKLDEVAKIVPNDKILAETDSPYLAPEPFRGTCNTPKNVIHIYQKLSSLRSVPLSSLAQQIRNNAHTLFYKL